MITNNLEKIREQYNLTKKDIAQTLGVSDSIYSRWEKGIDIIPTKRIYQLGHYYQINIDYLLGLTNKKVKITSIKQINKKLIAKRTREIRNDYHETLRTFSERLNTSNSTWSAYENGKVLILCAFLIEVCRFGNYSADWILGRTNKKYLNKNITVK